ncbi:MAG: hypothetical protein A4S09_09420 [Proteobacteria bacterium SG_bin7]|nr:MAG: hypothetical protein A4S09_09420 [Proteobacteria bacterium SG_bin7]
MKKLTSFRRITVVLLSTFFTFTAIADDEKPATAFRLKRGVGACSNLPTEADKFECKAIGWPDQNARVDLIRQEFVNKYGMTVRWGLFDYYYYFNGVKKCEPHKEIITDYLTTRKDLDQLWEKLGKSSDCVRKGQGWIQTRNIELFNGEPFVPQQKGSMEFKLVPAKKEAKVYTVPAPSYAQPVKKPEARHETTLAKEKRKLANITPSMKAKKQKPKYEDEEPMISVPMAPMKHESKQFWSEPFPKEFF